MLEPWQLPRSTHVTAAHWALLTWSWRAQALPVDWGIDEQLQIQQDVNLSLHEPLFIETNVQCCNHIWYETLQNCTAQVSFGRSAARSVYTTVGWKRGWGGKFFFYLWFTFICLLEKFAPWGFLVFSHIWATGQYWLNSGFLLSNIF